MAQLSLENIGQQIEQLESQLEFLRKNYQSRRSELEKLQQRRQELKSELEEVDTKIASLERGQSAPVAESSPKKSSSRTAGKKSSKAPGTRKSRKTSKSRSAAASSRNGKKTSRQPTLRMVITDILKNARKPLPAVELSKRALEAGYQTSSKKFLDVVHDLLRKMDNVNRIPNKGYELKREGK